MIIKELTQVGNPIIRRKSSVVKDFKSKKIKKTIKDLVDSMRHGNLVGIAAPQIGINQRIFLTEIRMTSLRTIDKDKEADDLRVFINPQVLSVSKKTFSEYEGCGSVAHANLFGKVSRPTSLVIKARDKNGEWFTMEAKGLLAKVILHELDHIDGKVFLDRLTDTKSLMSRSEYKKMFKKKKAHN
ncbi:MAG: Peptide deformylase [Parcubacteria group bacterium]|nr:Peptide deformylase [Parcubacteria group bacterium]